MSFLPLRRLTTSLFMDGLREAKRDLRKVMKSRLTALTDEDIASQSSAVTQAVLELPEYKNASRIGVYLSMPRGELSTRSIVLDALSRGKAVLVPYLHNLESPDPITGQTKSKMDMLSLKSKEDFESLKPDRWGIPTLDANTVHNRENTFGNLGVDQKNSTNVPCRLDLILVPGMAFDRQRRRLGHGKGYYDHFLYRYQAIFNDSGLAPQMPLLVALALREQLLPSEENVPVAEHDWPMDVVITADGAETSE